MNKFREQYHSSKQIIHDVIQKEHVLIQSIFNWNDGRVCQDIFGTTCPEAGHTTNYSWVTKNVSCKDKCVHTSGSLDNKSPAIFNFCSVNFLVFVTKLKACKYSQHCRSLRQAS